VARRSDGCPANSYRAASSTQKPVTHDCGRAFGATIQTHQTGPVDLDLDYFSTDAEEGNPWSTALAVFDFELDDASAGASLTSAADAAQLGLR
jgi:hypothetical protein